MAVGVASAWPGRARARANVFLGLLFGAVVGACAYCGIVMYEPGFVLPTTEAGPFVTWSEAPAGDEGRGPPHAVRKTLSIDASGRYVARISRGVEPSREVHGRLPLMELARLRQEVGEVSWGRAAFANGCFGPDCQTIVVGEGSRAVRASRDPSYGQSPWASPELWKLLDHMSKLHEHPPTYEVKDAWSEQ